LTGKFCTYGGQDFEALWAFAGGPFVVNPNDRGSSIGVTRIDGAEDCLCSEKDWMGGNWIIEPHLTGREITVGILDGHALPVIEICPRNGFYDYAQKHTMGITEHLV
jgi:D-alanine-D-alanine ligase